MVLIRREREHESQYLEFSNDPTPIQALRICGLLKFFWLPRMRDQLELLVYLSKHGIFKESASELEHKVSE